MTDASLSFRLPCDWETRVGPSDREVKARRGSLRAHAAGEIRICEQMRSNLGRIITNPPKHAKMFGGFDITDQSMQSSVTFGRPACKEARKVSDRPQEVESSHAGSVEKFHKDAGRMLSEASQSGGTTGRGIGLVTIRFRSIPVKIGGPFAFGTRLVQLIHVFVRVGRKRTVAPGALGDRTLSLIHI